MSDVYFMVVIKMPVFAVTAKNLPTLRVKQVAGAQSCGFVQSVGRHCVVCFSFGVCG